MEGLEICKIVYSYKNKGYKSYLCFKEFKDIKDIKGIKGNKDIKNYKDFKGFNDFEKNWLYDSLAQEEINMVKKIKSDKSKKNFLMGRYVAKAAVNLLTDYKSEGDIQIENGIFNYPIVVAKSLNNVQISLSHCNDFAAAVAFYEHCLLGIDVEILSPKSCVAMESSLGSCEKEMINKLYSQYGNKLFVVMWTAKEALAKAIKTGITIPFYLFEINEMWSVNNQLFCKYKYFKQYKAMSMTYDNHVITIAYPEKCAVSVEPLARVQHFPNNKRLL